MCTIRRACLASRAKTSKVQVFFRRRSDVHNSPGVPGLPREDLESPSFFFRDGPMCTIRRACLASHAQTSEAQVFFSETVGCAQFGGVVDIWPEKSSTLDINTCPAHWARAAGSNASSRLMQ